MSVTSGAYILLHIFSKWAVSRQCSPPTSQLRKLGSRDLRGCQGHRREAQPRTRCVPAASGSVVERPLPLLIPQRPGDGQGCTAPVATQAPASRDKESRAVYGEEHPDPTQLQPDAGCDNHLLFLMFSPKQTELEPPPPHTKLPPT